MASCLSKERKRLFDVLIEHYYVQRSLICRGSVRHDGRRPPHLYEAFVEVCCLLLLLGDAFGYIAVDSDGDVDPVRSYGPFVDRLMVCLEVAHVWRISHCPVGSTPDNRTVMSGRKRTKVLLGFKPFFRVKLVDEAYPFFFRGKTPKHGSLMCLDIKQLFLTTSREAFFLPQQGIVGQCPNRFTGDEIYDLQLFLTTRRRSNKSDEEFNVFLEGKESLPESSVVAYDVSHVRQRDYEVWRNNQFDVHLSLQKYVPRQTVYDGLRRVLSKHKVLVSCFSGEMN